MKLSPHFTLEEFLRSETAARHDINMTPPSAVLANLERLANEILEAIRQAVGGPIHITSGYRPLTLNNLVGGARNSDHLTGSAADIYALELELYEFAETCRFICNSLPVKQCILEFPPEGWIHVSIAPLGALPEREYLTALRRDGQTVYEVWDA